VPSGSKSELQLRVGGGGSVELTQKAPARPALNLAAEDALHAIPLHFAGSNWRLMFVWRSRRGARSP